jgi:aerobic-type carbon monoxide dehydrogenase small subunit (CoxS/CutS family)
MVLALRAKRADVLTIEGLATGEVPYPMQEAPRVQIP